MVMLWKIRFFENTDFVFITGKCFEKVVVYFKNMKLLCILETKKTFKNESVEF